MWDPVIPNLSRNFKVICFDMPGFGKSPLQSENTSMQLMADLVSQSLVSMGLKEKIILTGVSMGGYVALEFVKKYPGQMRGLGLISTRATADTEENRNKRFETIKRVQENGSAALAEKMAPALLGPKNQEKIEWIQNEISNAQPEAICAALRGMADRRDNSAILNKISVPTFVAYGAEDTLIRKEEMETMSNAIPKSNFHVIENAGHLLTIEQTDQFLDLFRHYLKRNIL